MSAQLAPIERSDRTGATRAPQLRALPFARHRIGRVPFLVILGLVVGLAMLGILVLSVNIQQQSSRLADLTEQGEQLGYDQAQLQSQVDSLSSTTSLVAQAYRMGLRPNPRPAFIQVSNGHILGTPTRVTGKEMTDQVPATVLQQASAIAAAQSAKPTPSAGASASASPSARSSAAASTPGRAQASAPATAAGQGGATAPALRPTTGHNTTGRTTTGHNTTGRTTTGHTTSGRTTTPTSHASTSTTHRSTTTRTNTTRRNTTRTNTGGTAGH